MLNISFRHFFDQTTIFIFVLLFLNYLLDIFHTMQDTVLSANEVPALKYELSVEQVQEHTQFYLFVILFFAINVPVATICDWIYHVDYEKSIVIEIDNIMDLALGFFSWYHVYIIWFLDLYEREAVQQELWIVHFCLVGLLFLKGIFCFSATRQFGPFIIILKYLLIECGKFLIIFAVVMLLFTYIGYILFNQQQQGHYVNYFRSLQYLIEVMFGQFVFNDYRLKYPVLGMAFLFIFLVASTLIFMNVTTAILAFTFDRANREGNVMFT